jgi:hypothetical protein
MMQKVLMAALSALLTLAPVALAENTNTGPGMTGSSGSAATGVNSGTTTQSTTTSKGITTKKSGIRPNIFHFHKNKQIRRHPARMRHIHRRIMMNRK